MAQADPFTSADAAFERPSGAKLGFI